MVPYWPNSKELLKAGQIQVRLASSDKFKNFEIRNFEITHSEVRSFDVPGEPEKSST